MKTQNAIVILSLARWQYDYIYILLSITFTLPSIGNVARLRLPGCQVAKYLYRHGEFILNTTNTNASSRPLYTSYGVMCIGLKVHCLPLEERKIDVIFDVLDLVFGDVFSTYIPKNK